MDSATLCIFAGLGLKLGKEEEVAFPETLEEFGYHFNAGLHY